MTTAVSAQDRAARLRDYLQEHDSPCPTCGYNLRGLEDDRCPECAQHVRLGVSAVGPRLHAAPVAVVGLGIGGGFGAMLLLLAWYTSWTEPAQAAAWGRVAWLGAAALGSSLLLAALVHLWRGWLAEATLASRLVVVGLAWALAVAWVAALIVLAA